MAKKPAKSGKPRASPLKATAPRKKVEESSCLRLLPRLPTKQVRNRRPRLTCNVRRRHRYRNRFQQLTIKFSNNIIKQIVDGLREAPKASLNPRRLRVSLPAEPRAPISDNGEQGCHELFALACRAH